MPRGMAKKKKKTNSVLKKKRERKIKGGCLTNIRKQALKKKFFFHHPDKIPHAYLQFIPTPTLSPHVTTNLLSVSINLPYRDISYKWNHTL